MSPVQVVRDPRGLAELLVQKVDDRALPQLLKALEMLRKTPLKESSFNRVFKKAGLDNKQVPRWFRKWLKSTLLGGPDGVRPYPFAINKVPDDLVEETVANIGTYVLGLRLHKSDVYTDFVLRHDMAETDAQERKRILATGPLRRLSFPMEKAWELAQSMDIQKLQFVEETLRKHYQKELLREEVVTMMSSRLPYHVDVLQPVYEHALGDRKKELGIFTEAKRFNRELLLRHLTKELKLIAVRCQQPDVNQSVVDDSYELPVEALVPQADAAEEEEGGDSSRLAMARKSFNFLQQRMYIGIHHIFQLNVACESKHVPTVKPTRKQQVTLAKTVEGGEEVLHKVLDVLEAPKAEDVSLEAYMQEASTVADDDDGNADGAASGDKAHDSPPSNFRIAHSMTAEEMDTRFQLRTQEYTALLAQLKDDDEAGGVRRDMAAAMAAVGLSDLPQEQQLQLWKIVEEQRQAMDAARIEAVRERLPEASAKRKVMLTNLPRSVREETIRDALRNVGPVEKVWIFCHDFVAEPGAPHKRLDKAAEDLGDADDDDADDDDADHADDDPLAIFGSDGSAPSGDSRSSSSSGSGSSEGPTTQKKRRPIVRRKILERMRLMGNQTRPQSDTYAFVTFADDAGYQRALSDDMRIFGLNIEGHTCKMSPATSRKSFLIEMHYPMRVSHVMHVLNMCIGQDYNVKLHRPGQDDRSKPVFLRLFFGSHEESWLAFTLLGQNKMIHDSVVTQPTLPAEHPLNLGYELDAHGEANKVAPAAWHLTWLRTRNFWELSLRARRSLEGLEYKHLTDTYAADLERSRLADRAARDLGSVVAFDGDAQLDDDIVLEPDDEPFAAAGDSGDDALVSAPRPRATGDAKSRRSAATAHTAAVRVKKITEDPFVLDERGFPLPDDVLDADGGHQNY